jgi:hypothetical protein
MSVISNDFTFQSCSLTQVIINTSSLHYLFGIARYMDFVRRLMFQKEEDVSVT